MTQRAIAVRYSGERVNEANKIEFFASVVYLDTADATVTAIYAPQILLDPATPATWGADIKAAIAAQGVAAGFSTLVAANCITPTYA
jgi:hypothetical protein